MVQVITNLGDSGSLNTMAVIRPIFVSLAFSLAVPIFCHFAIIPLTKWLTDQRMIFPESMLSRLFGSQKSAFVMHTTILVGMITGASYAGTSSLFAAYLSGAAISWWDTEVPHTSSCITEDKPTLSNTVSRETTDTGPNLRASPENREDQIMAAPPVRIETNQNLEVTPSGQTVAPPSQNKARMHRDPRNKTSGIVIFQKYYQQTLHRVLKPFFFASIGFSVPITRMFKGSVVWRGIIYTAIMVLAKLLCGLWLIRWEMPGFLSPIFKVRKPYPERNKSPGCHPSGRANREIDRPESGSKAKPDTQQANTSAKLDRTLKHSHQSSKVANPVSIYPGSIVGCAMVARGEIGFLISSIAERNGIFGGDANGQLFLTVTWAIILCTVIGPICVGIMVRRLKRLSQGKGDGGGSGRDVLGVWGLT